MRVVPLISCLSVAILLYASACFAQPALPKPGPEHAALRKMEGTWDAEITLLGSVKGKGSSTFKMECGGLWLERDFKCDLGGLALHTKGLDGYDPQKRKHVSVQFDAMTTVPTLLEGTYDDSTKTLTQTGEARDFKGAPEQVKHVTKHIDDDHMSVEVYRIYPDGKERRMLAIEYARRKEAK